MPMMPFIGVRISWLMLARNWLLARLALSAASFARRSSAVRVWTVSSRRSRWAASSRSRLASSPSMVLKASASSPISSPVVRVARRAKSRDSDTCRAVSVRAVMAPLMERWRRIATAVARTKASASATPKSRNYSATVAHRLSSRLTTASDPINSPPLYIGTITDRVTQSKWVVKCSARRVVGGGRGACQPFAV